MFRPTSDSLHPLTRGLDNELTLPFTTSCLCDGWDPGQLSNQLSHILCVLLSKVNRSLTATRGFHSVELSVLPIPFPNILCLRDAGSMFNWKKEYRLKTLSKYLSVEKHHSAWKEILISLQYAWSFRSLRKVKRVCHKKTVWFHLIIGTERRAVVVRAYGRREQELLFTGYRVFVLRDKENSGDRWWWQLHIIRNIFNTSELHTLKW